MRHPSTPFCNARRAAVAVQVALTMTVLLGMLAIVVDGGLLLAQRQRQQAAADAAAMAYAAAMANGLTPAEAQTSALATAAANGAANDGTYSLITPNTSTTNGGVTTALHGIWNGPITGTFEGKAGTTGYATGYVQVVVEYDEVRLFSALWGTGTLPVRAQAVASWGPNYWSPSILSLGLAGSGVDLYDSTAQITVPGPIIANAGLSVSVAGGGKITSTSGPINYCGTLTGTAYSPTPTKVSTTTPDPLASIAVPAMPGAPQAPSGTATLSNGILATNSGTSTIYPGTYTSIDISGSANVTMSPGIYYLEGGASAPGGNSLIINGATVTGSGVLIYNGETGGATNNPNSVGQILIQSNAVVQLTPMTSGTWQGISIFQDRNASTAMTLQGGGNTNIAGMIYAPGSNVTISGATNSVPGTSFITNTLTIIGGSTFTIPTPTVKAARSPARAQERSGWCSRTGRDQCSTRTLKAVLAHGAQKISKRKSPKEELEPRPKEARRVR